MSHLPAQGARNGLLSRLSAAELAVLTPKLVPVILSQGRVLHPVDGVIEAAYFPLSGVLSMVAQLRDGTQVEAGVVGAEGMAGASLAAGVSVALVECMVQLPGTALRLDAASFRDALDAMPGLRRAVFRHQEAMLAQAVQNVPCNARHTLSQRLARWLLMAHDRAQGDEMALTQEFLATMLAAHRPNVSPAAGTLQRAGAIRYRHGHVTVLDRAALEGCACECYAVLRRRCDLVLSAA